MEKPPPYNPNMSAPLPPNYGPPPQYQVTNPIGFTLPGGSTTVITQPPINYGTIPVVIQPVVANDVILIGGCPACRVGVLQDRFTLAGICCAFFFFPLGLICCLLMTERQCTTCGASFT